MVGTASSSSSSSSPPSSCTSFGTFEDVTTTAVKTVKFLCSHGGKILPRYPDGKLRYVGGETRVLAVHRSIPFSELRAKMGELCGWGCAAAIRCQLPSEDLDALVSVTSDDDFANLLEEYDVAGRDGFKIRAFLFPLTSKPPKAPAVASASASSIIKGKYPYCYRTPIAGCCFHHPSSGRPDGQARLLHVHRTCLAHPGKHGWQ